MIWFSGDKHLFHEMMVRGKRSCVECKRPIKTTEPDGPTSCCQAAMVQTEAPPRPMFANIWDMNKRIIDNHNEVVEKGDLVYELGDIFLKINAKIARETRYLMNGNFYFINGNHDQVAEQISDCFVWMKDLVRIKPAGFETPHITLCHYAMVSGMAPTKARGNCMDIHTANSPKPRRGSRLMWEWTPTTSTRSPSSR